MARAFLGFCTAPCGHAFEKLLRSSQTASSNWICSKHCVLSFLRQRACRLRLGKAFANTAQDLASCTTRLQIQWCLGCLSRCSTARCCHLPLQTGAIRPALHQLPRKPSVSRGISQGPQTRCSARSLRHSVWYRSSSVRKKPARSRFRRPPTAAVAGDLLPKVCMRVVHACKNSSRDDTVHVKGRYKGSQYAQGRGKTMCDRSWDTRSRVCLLPEMQRPS